MEDRTMLGLVKNKMYVFYNVSHLTRDHHEFTIRALINEMVSKYHLGYNVEFIDSDVNKVVVKSRKKKANLAKLRLTQIKANRMLRDLVSIDKLHTKN